jgi:archaellum component FlaC
MDTNTKQEQHTCKHDQEIGSLIEFKNNAKGKINELDNRVDKLEKYFIQISNDIKFLKNIRKEEMLWIRGIGIALLGFITIFLIKTVIFKI